MARLLRSRRTSRRLFRKPRSIGRKVRNLDRKVRELARAPELKFHDSYFQQNVGTSPSLMFVAAVPIGDQVYNRDGDSIEATSLQVKWELSNFGNTSDVYNWFRIVVFDIKQLTGDTLGVGGAAGVYGYLFNNVSGTPTAHLPTLNLYNHENLGNFRILYDKKVLLFGGDKATDNLVYPMGVLKHGSTKVTLNKKKIDYEAGSDGTSTSHYLRNFIGVLVFSDSGVADHPLITMTSRLYYRDP